MSISDDLRQCLEDCRGAHPSLACRRFGPADTLRAWPMADTRDYGLAEGAGPVHDATLVGSPSEIAIVIDAPSVLSRVQTRQLLAALRNRGIGAIVAAFRVEPARSEGRWSTSEFLGLGFRRLPATRDIRSHYWLYRYDIHDYKITPDWLNARHWANPGRWDKQRW